MLIKNKKMKTIILRLDLNVPINEKSRILDTERIDRVIPEIKKLSEKNKIVILAHLGKGKIKDSLGPVEKYIRKRLEEKQNKNIVFLENVRFWIGETQKVNSKEFKETSKYFASLGDEFINDAFPSMHRAHASIIGVPTVFKKENKKYKLGENAQKEIKEIEKSLNFLKNKNKKSLAIIGGAKISTKLPLIKKLLNENCVVFVGGGMANQVLKDIKNINIGKSFIENNYKIDKNTSKIFDQKIKERKLLLPIDAILQNLRVEDIDNIRNNKVSDIGPASFALIQEAIKESDNIIMNGPLGIYEKDFNKSTLAILKILKSEMKKRILIGGGDTLALIRKIKIENRNNLFVSTGGGAMLDYIANDGHLPGIDILK
jgi:phosphoglycerate kinase